MEKPFRTLVEVLPTSFGLNYHSPSIFLGSCFAENVGEILKVRKFPIQVNPFGVIYNPVSVEMAIRRIAFGELVKEDELNFRNNLWFSFLHDTFFSNPDKNKCIENINSSLSLVKSNWKKAEHLVVTFGTARVYYTVNGNNPVANCHKLPAVEFENRLLSVTEIVNSWSKLLADIIIQKPSIKVAFTVSPIRHWKDGATGNLVSKATLILAVHELLKQFPANTYYFPAYEILHDDLRDYRFYADDMLHPSSMAVNYIWGKFSEAYIANSAKGTMEEVEKIVQALSHRPIRIDTKEYKAFVEKVFNQIGQVSIKNPEIDFSLEINELTEKLKGK